MANLVAGLEKADSGAVYMEGSGGRIDLLAKGSRQLRKEYGQKRQMIFQNPRLSFNPAMTIGKGLEEALRYYTKLSKEEGTGKSGTGRIEKRIL